MLEASPNINLDRSFDPVTLKSESRDTWGP